MTIEVSLRPIEVDGVVYPVPTHLTWHKTPRRWAILLPSQNGERLVIGFPAQRHGGVRGAFIAATSHLEKARKESEVFLQTTRKDLYERKRDKTLGIGIELDIQYQKTAVVHYLRVSVGSHTADTLMRRNLRVGEANKYTKQHYDRVYAKAVEAREFLLKKHAQLLLERRAASEREVKELIQKFLRETASVVA